MFDINKCYDSFATEPNKAYFWHGKSAGYDAQEVATAIAEKENSKQRKNIYDC